MNPGDVLVLVIHCITHLCEVIHVDVVTSLSIPNNADYRHDLDGDDDAMMTNQCEITNDDDGNADAICIDDEGAPMGKFDDRTGELPIASEPVNLNRRLWAYFDHTLIIL